MTQIGPYKDQESARWTTAQIGHIQHVVDNFSFDFDLMNGDCILEFVRTLGTLNGNVVWGQRFPGRVLKIRKDLTQNETRYTIPHETGHQVIVDMLSTADRAAIQQLLLPHGAYGLGGGGDWQDGPYPWKASECFCDDFAKIYAGSGASWKNVLEGSNPPTSRFYRRSFDRDAINNVAAAKNIIENGEGGGEDPPEDGDPFFPVAVTFDAVKDLSRRHKKSGGTNQGSGGEKHLPMGFLDIEGTGNDWVYDALVQFGLDWPEDVQKIWEASLELTVIHGSGEHISGSGDKSFLQAKRVTADWVEGNNAEGTWDASDYKNPSTASNVASLGAVGTQVTGTRLPFDVMSFVKKWAPASVQVEGLGAGEHEPNHGLLLSMSRLDKIEGATMFASQDYGTNSDRPKLYLTYTPTSAKPVCLLTSPAGAINTNLFEFIGEYSDPFANDKLGQVDIEVKRGTNTIWQPLPRNASANEIALGDFSTDSLAQGAPVWAVGNNYSWRARVQSASSNKWSDWTDWLDFTISNVAPTVSATSLGSKVTLAGVFFGGPFTGPAQPPPPNPTGPLARMTMIDNPGAWSSRTVAEQNTAIAQMVEMHQRGVVLQCIDWSAPRDHTPSDLTARLDRYIAAGFTPYLGMWLKEFGDTGTFNETQHALDIWAAGAGRWGGAIVDIEDAWSDFNRDHPVQADANVTAWVAAMRGVMGGAPLGYISYPVPGFIPNIDWNLLDDLFDLYMPAIFYSGPNGDGPGDTERIMDRTANSIASHNMVKPYVPLMNVWGSDANANNRRQFITRSLAEHGSVASWRMPVRNSEVRDVFTEFPRDAPEGG